jgi:hypothetical protein
MLISRISIALNKAEKLLRLRLAFIFFAGCCDAIKAGDHFFQFLNPAAKLPNFRSA